MISRANNVPSPRSRAKHYCSRPLRRSQKIMRSAIHSPSRMYLDELLSREERLCRLFVQKNRNAKFEADAVLSELLALTVTRITTPDTVNSVSFGVKTS